MMLRLTSHGQWRVYVSAGWRARRVRSEHGCECPSSDGSARVTQNIARTQPVRICAGSAWHRPLAARLVVHSLVCFVRLADSCHRGPLVQCSPAYKTTLREGLAQRVLVCSPNHGRGLVRHGLSEIFGDERALAAPVGEGTTGRGRFGH